MMPGGGALLGVSKSQLKGELESLKDFKKRVDGILKDLSSSKASPMRMGQQEVVRASFGGEFTEADDLFRQYNRVHHHLTGLSRVLGMQIEAMGIAVQGADVGFSNLEDDVKRRFWEIQSGSQQFQQEQQQRAEHGQPKADDDQATY